MSRKYYFNQETQKIELRDLSKEEYQSLSEDLKREIKRAFLFSGKCGAWVSRSTNNHYSAIRTAEKLGFTEKEIIGERLSFAEGLERKAEKAEARAERYEQYSDNAEKRAEQLQSALKSYHGDITFFTQPIIAGHSGSQAFARYREKLFNRYRKGFEEYEKSEYYKERAETARTTAENSKLKDKVYLHKKIKECNKNLKAYQSYIVKYEEILYRLQQGEELKNWKGDLLTIERTEKGIEEQLDKYDYEQGKLEFFEKCMENLGGCNFSNDNIKVGYIVNIARWGKCEVVSTGRINFQYKILEGGAKGLGGTEPYEAIIEILEVKEVEELENPYNENDILVHYNIGGNKIIKAYQVLKVTAKGIQIQEINIDDNNKPVFNGFKVNSKPMRKGITKSKYSNFVGAYDGDWQLHKYNEVA